MRFFILTVLLLAPARLFAQDKPTIVVKVQPPSDIDPSLAATPAQIREYFQVVGLDKTLRNVMHQMFAAMHAVSPPYMPDTVWKDMEKTFQDYDLQSELIPVYQKHLTRDDLTAALAFYRTDAGKHILANQSIMTEETQARFAEIGRKLGQEVGERHSEEILAAKKKYEQGIADKQNLLGSPPPLR